MTKILDLANKIAKDSGFKFNVEPVTKWRRPVSKENVAGFELTSVGILTAAESCVVNQFRKEYQVVSEGQKAAILVIFVDIAERLKLETVGEVMSVVNNPVELEAQMKEHKISKKIEKKWVEGIKSAGTDFDVEKAAASLKYDVVTFLLAMRYDAEWDFEDTAQLSATEFDAISEFVNKEEGLSDTSDSVPEENKTPKKP